MAGLSALLQAEIAVQRCDFENASAHIDVGRAFKEIFGPVEPQLVALRNEARLHAHGARLDLAVQVLQEGQEAALREQHRRLYVALAVEEASLQLTAGDITGAAATARRTRLLDAEIAGPEISRVQRDALRLVSARFKIAYGDARSAARILSTLQQSRGSETRGGFFLCVTAHRAVALWELRQEADAARQLNRALIAAAPEFHAYPIASAGRSLLPVLEFVRERRSEATAEDLKPLLDLQNWLSSKLRGESPLRTTVDDLVPAPAERTVEALTPREIELLRLLHAGLSNQELADALLLSVPTIKWHLHNVYSKLGVGSRGAAVAHAIKSGLVSG